MNNLAEKQQERGGMRSIMRSAKQAETVSKTKTPVLEVEPEIKELAQDILEWKRQLDNAKTKFSEKSADLIAKITDRRTELCRKEYTSTVKIPTTEGALISVTWTTKYDSIKPEVEPMLLEILGDAYYDYFNVRFVIKATDKSDDEMYRFWEWLGGDAEDGSAEAKIALGQQRFYDFFVVEEINTPTEKFAHDHVLMPEIKRQELALAGVRQYNPSVKAR